nr:MAG TPA: hypothetical protein [Caudoviricetes sp.]
MYPVQMRPLKCQLGSLISFYDQNKWPQKRQLMYAMAKHYAIIQTGIGSPFGLKP